MSPMFIINLVHIFFPLMVGLIFSFFSAKDNRINKLNFYIYCLIYFILSVLSVILILADIYEPDSFFTLGAISLYPQKELAKFLLFIPFVYFVQMKKHSKNKDSFSIGVLFQGIFYTILSLSVYVKGGIETYGMLELLVLFAMILDTIDNKLWGKASVMLQGLGTAFIFVSLVVLNVLEKNYGLESQVSFLSDENLKVVLSLALLLGILFKSTVIEGKREGVRNTGHNAIHLLVLKLYIPIRLLFESSIFQLMESNSIVGWAIILICLFNCLKITERKSQLGILELSGLLASFILWGFTISGSTGLTYLGKFSFFSILMLVLYSSIKNRREDYSFALIVAILAVVEMVSTVYSLSESNVVANKNLVLLITSMVILYLMIKYIWKSFVESFREARIGIHNIEDYIVRNSTIIFIVLILTGFNIEYFERLGTWLN